ncbi:hypothetical protein PQR75_40090 [Paraburkholderia fungorum]|uniref:hypothetical protein n=1 Tax=Paraburkholderia fungorum TaxID=134537 RepID=UPI0038B6B578
MTTPNTATHNDELLIDAVMSWAHKLNVYAPDGVDYILQAYVRVRDPVNGDVIGLGADDFSVIGLASWTDNEAGQRLPVQEVSENFSFAGVPAGTYVLGLGSPGTDKGPRECALLIGVANPTTNRSGYKLVSVVLSPVEAA